MAAGLGLDGEQGQAGTGESQMSMGDCANDKNRFFERLPDSNYADYGGDYVGITGGLRDYGGD